MDTILSQGGVVRKKTERMGGRIGGELMSWENWDYTDEYREELLCDGLTEDSLEDAGYRSGFDSLDEQESCYYSGIFDDSYDEGW